MDELNEIVAQLEGEWMGYMYDMWHKNCNHFCDALANVCQRNRRMAWRSPKYLC